jgi:hypothetical protein
MFGIMYHPKDSMNLLISACTDPKRGVMVTPDEEFKRQNLWH